MWQAPSAWKIAVGGSEVTQPSVRSQHSGKRNWLELPYNPGSIKRKKGGRKYSKSCRKMHLTQWGQRGLWGPVLMGRTCERQAEEIANVEHEAKMLRDRAQHCRFRSRAQWQESRGHRKDLHWKRPTHRACYEPFPCLICCFLFFGPLCIHSYAGCRQILTRFRLHFPQQN